MSMESQDLAYKMVTEAATGANSSRGLNAYSANDMAMVFGGAATALAKNPLCPVTMTTKTAGSYAAAMGVKDNACDVKNKGRAAAFFDIRNHLSQACGIEVLMDGVHLFLMVSSDDVAVQLYGWEKGQRALTTKEANQWNRSIGVGLSMSYEQKQRRVVKFFNSTVYPSLSCPTGLLCSIMKLADWNFPDVPRVFDMSNGFFVICYHPTDTDKSTLAFLQYSLSIMPSAEKLRSVSIFFYLAKLYIRTLFSNFSNAHFAQA
jgi:hypothetical protein